MELYLMQHGEARAKEEDPDRPLTDKGRASVEGVARRAAGLGLRMDVIQHSGILRARQTAEVLANYLGALERVHEREGLTPLDPTAPVADWLLALVAGEEAVQVLSFSMGGLVKLIPKQQRTGFAVAWVLVPELA